MEKKNIDGQLRFDNDLNVSEQEPGENKTVQTVEFQIGKPAKEENLIFEVGTEKDKEEKAEMKIVEPIVEELVIGTPPAPAKKEKAPLPETSSDESAPEQSAAPVKRSVYVPRFTEASEKYRKVLDPRARALMNDKRLSARVEVTSEPEEKTEVTASEIDPTAEIETVPENQVFVNVSNSEPEPEMLNVFKFAKEEETAPVEELNEEQEEIEEIERLIAREPEPEKEEEQIEEAPSEELEAEQNEDIEIAEDTAIAEDEEYVLPDPDKQIVIDDFLASPSEAPSEPVPDFVKDDDTDAKGKKSEFTHQSQRDSFKDRFLDTIVAHKIRMGAIAIFSLVLLLFELFASLGKIPVTVWQASSYRGALALVDLLFVGCIFLLAIPETARAVKNICKGRFSFELSLPLGFLVILSYLITVMLVPTKAYSLYGFIFAAVALIAVFASYYQILGDFVSFKHMSKNCEKKILDIKMTRELPEENIALDGLVDEYNSRTSRIFRAAFVTDFFERVSLVTDKKAEIITALSVSFGAALVSALICFFIPGGIVAAMSAFALVFLVSCPAFAILSGKIPYYDAQLATLSENSTVLGEKAYFDFSEVDVIAFDDTEIFGVEDVNLKRFMLYGDRDNIEKAMRQMYSLFSVVGGPLYKIFAKALDNRVRHTPATAVEIEADGVSGEISGTRIYAGSETYMRRHGIATPAAQSDMGADTTKVMYAAESGEVYAKFYIRYSFSEEFTMLLPSMKEEKIVPLIYTNDPNLSNELLKTLSAGADCMRVVKKLKPDEEAGRIYRRVSAGVVTYGDKINAINTVLLSRRYKAFAERLSISALYSISAGVVVTAILAVLGVTLPSLVFGLWHIGWCVALRAISRRIFPRDKKEN